MLTDTQIVSTVDGLPPQGRIMIRLLLLQYLDVTQDDIEFMAMDRPDPRFQSGGKPPTPYLSKETLTGITNRVAQYREHHRRKRERLKLQIDCLNKQLAFGEGLARQAESLLRGRFGMGADAVQACKASARHAVSKPAIRELTRKWMQDEIDEESFLGQRLAIELQRVLRRIDVDKRRLSQATKDFGLANTASLQDHEIAHIWGIPAGSLAARKVKLIGQYVETLHKQMPSSSAGGAASGDLWKETFATLSTRPIERSVALYDGLEGSEAALLDKLTAFAWIKLAEELELRFWTDVCSEWKHQAEHIPQSLFALQRLAAILDEIDMSPDALEAHALERIAPPPKAEPAALPAEAAAPPLQLTEQQEYLLRNFRGDPA